MSIGVLPLSWATSTLGMTRDSVSTLGTTGMPGKRAGNGFFLPGSSNQELGKALSLFRGCLAGFCTVFLFLMSGPALPVLHSHSLIPILQGPPVPYLCHTKTEPETLHTPNHSSSSQGASQPGAKQAASRTVMQIPSPVGSVPFSTLLEGN